MRVLGSTRKELEENLMIAMTWITAGLVGLGIGLWLTVYFLVQGSQVILIGAVTGLLGWIAIKLFLGLGRFQDIYCPNCMTRHQVWKYAGKFHCDPCGQRIFGRSFWQAGSAQGNMTRSQPGPSPVILTLQLQQDGTQS